MKKKKFTKTQTTNKKEYALVLAGLGVLTMAMLCLGMIAAKSFKAEPQTVEDYAHAIKALNASDHTKVLIEFAIHPRIMDASNKNLADEDLKNGPLFTEYLQRNNTLYVRAGVEKYNEMMKGWFKENNVEPTLPMYVLIDENNKKEVYHTISGVLRSYILETYPHL